MMKAETPQSPRGAVVTLSNRCREPEHEAAIHAALARRIAALQGMVYLGEHDTNVAHPGKLFFVPTGTIVGTRQARELGMTDESDLFGGVVPQAFVETKAISHPLVRPDAEAPLGWSRSFGALVKDCVLRGYSAFTLADAREAGRRLLQEGPLRIKPVRATGGRGQQRVDSEQALDQALAHLDEAELRQFGLVLEAHLDQVTTYSVGQVRLAGRTISYYGTQRLTPDNSGEEVYGGSDLIVVDGGFEALLALGLDAGTQQAVSQAQLYDEAASECYREFFASRRNYDVARGIDGKGRACSGVLEQSWRIGGASSAEIAALELIARGEGGTAVRASSVEVYGENPDLPDTATLLFQGLDAEVGYITKYVTVEAHGNA